MQQSTTSRSVRAVRAAALLCALAVSASAAAAPDDGQCSYYQAGTRNLYWGDMHVHTAYSLDAYGFGTLNTPRDAYRFARGETVALPDGTPARLDRPLDFVAVTDHAEWLDFMYVCTDPENADLPDCRFLRENSNPEQGSSVFGKYVVPSITKAEPHALAVCSEDPERCAEASSRQWLRIQQQANEADDPCNFSALIGFEWSATPSFSHTHRNVIFASEHVTPFAIDYIRYPAVADLWEQLDLHCKADAGCDAITIPHNTNMGDGFSFDVESESDRVLQMRSRYERLVEVHQEKGNSECLSPFGVRDESDCNFEVRLTRSSQLTPADQYDHAGWEKMRGSYARGLLLRGLAAYDRSGAARRNPLQLGLIGSTDNHAAKPGYVDESSWLGSVFGIGNFERTMSRLDFNPGGLVAVWAEQNTRASLFDALKRREVYATSGPRIRLQFSASTDARPLDCSAGPHGDVPMGGEFYAAAAAPQFMVHAQYDHTPLQKFEVIKGSWSPRDGYQESVTTIWEGKGDGRDVCVVWRDPSFAADQPAFWYARVQEAPSPRWSASMCERAGRCDEFPQADTQIKERAWSSPVWYLPGN
ncbi:MAG: DUF3604 domain-containing protein [Pseudomonadales bacterium]